MDKELDPLRELEQSAERNDLPPTTEIRSRTLPPLPAGTTAPTSPEAPQRPQTGSGSTPTPNRLPTINHPQSGGVRSNRYGNLPKVRITENIAAQQQIRFGAGMGPVFILFVLGVIVAVLTIGIFSGANTPVTPVKSPKDPLLPEPVSFIDPLFGQFAVKKCAERCDLRSSPAKEACVRGCNMYNLNIYGRRITLDKFDPANDANEIVTRCMKRDVHLDSNASGSAWYEDIQNALRLVDESPGTVKNGEFTKLRAQYHKLLDANAKLRLPPGGTSQEVDLAQNLVRTTCMQANQVLAAIAMGTAQQNSDQFSTRYFRQLAQSVEQKTNEVSTATLAQAKAMKLY